MKIFLDVLISLLIFGGCIILYMKALRYILGYKTESEHKEMLKLIFKDNPKILKHIENGTLDNFWELEYPRYCSK
jgi:hypothetical protein